MNDSIDAEWMNYLSSQAKDSFGVLIDKTPIKKNVELSIPNSIVSAPCSELFISTKTKVLFLNQFIDIQNVFWEIPIIEYWKPEQGIIKKQMKIVSKDSAECDKLKEKLANTSYYTENIIKQIDNPGARGIKFKDERKITIGISRKDIINSRGKVKNAFYNCFAMILRFKYEDSFKEIHVKVFNTGKLEIPGIINMTLLGIVKEMVLSVLTPLVETELKYNDNDDDDNVLINSNFNCGYFINRDKLHSILKSEKYRIESAYDPCSYPGVKCKFYFNHDLGFDKDKQNGKIVLDDRNMKMSELTDNKKYTEVSFMIFRTGSGLIVGNCSDKILFYIFDYIKTLLADEYTNICVANEQVITKTKVFKIRKRTIMMTPEYYKENRRFS